MSLDDDNHASTHSTKMRVRRSMDIEFHDHLYDDLFDELQEWDTQNNQEENMPKNEADADEDSFGEATDSCQPDHDFLEQILEEYHPERINLLDPTVPESVYNKKPRSTETSVASNSQSKATEQLNNEKPPLVTDVSSVSTRSSGANNDGDDDTRTKHKSTKADDSESITEEDGDDAFLKSPQPRGNDRSTLYGEETKRSLRTINGTFWSKPFKGLSPSVRGDGSVSDS